LPSSVVLYWLIWLQAYSPNWLIFPILPSAILLKVHRYGFLAWSYHCATTKQDVCLLLAD
jgi:hypothetical protein